MAKPIPQDMLPGTTHVMKNGSTLTIVDYINGHSVEYLFEKTGFSGSCESVQIRRGNVKDRLEPVTFGIGYIGAGPYTSRNSPKARNAWFNMLARCYGDDAHVKSPSYCGVTVCPEWHNFQSFAKWFNDNYPSSGGEYQLDKDLKVLNNKIYSPDTCLMVKPEVNAFLTDRCSLRGANPIGVHVDTESGKYASQITNQITKKKEHLGYFADQGSAHNAWRKAKSSLALNLASMQDNIEVRDGLIRYAKALDNFEIYSDGYEK